ncbi:hypothetical protein [Sinorhizobium fredii]|uniref:hypothetical protein n=1 Tax=Rhizobium fredii TaxID=380 RepID=UPI0035115F04
MEPLRRQAIADYLSQLNAGLRDLVSRSEKVRAAYEAELASMGSEIARYRELIANAERESEQEVELSRSESGQGFKGAEAPLKLSTSDGLRPKRGRSDPSPRTTKAENLRIAAEKILRAHAQPLKRADLTRQLQSTGLLANSDNPIDLVRKLLQKSEVIGYDTKRGYFLVELGD